MRKKILIILSIILLSLNFFPADINGEPEYNGKERYYPNLGHIKSLAQLEAYVDKCAEMKKFDVHSPQYSAMLAYVISCRFYHGFSHWKMSENWVAALGEKVFGYGLASKVEPEDILQHPYAACSQQTIVMMAVLRKKGIPYRKVGFPHHYAIEVHVNNSWYYFDPNMEPRMNLRQREHDQWAGINDNLKAFYNPIVHHNLNYQFGKGCKAEFGPINEVPARNASLFQSATAIISRIAWMFPLAFALVRRRPYMYAIKTNRRRMIYRIPSHYPYYS